MKLYHFLIALTLFAGCKKTDDTDPNEQGPFHNRDVGASANELLSAAKYKSLQAQVHYMTGYQPDAAALSQLQNFLQSLLNKPEGISFEVTEIPPASASSLSIDQVASIEQRVRTAFASERHITIHIIYTNGSFTQAGVLGAAYKNTSAVIFGKTIHDNSGGLGQVSRTKLETTVLQHEFAHLFGLVDLGSKMQTPHKDQAHGAHCTNQNCLMYYTAETSDILGVLLTGNVPALDAACLSDLRANGGK